MKAEDKIYNDAHNIAKDITDAMQNKKALEECDAFWEFIDNSEAAPILIDRLLSAERVETISYRINSIDAEKSANKLNGLLKKKKSITIRRRVWASAMSVAAVIAISFYLLNNEGENLSTQIVNQVSTPTLILSNGENINLLSVNNIIDADNTIINSLNQIQYKNSSNNSSKITYNTIITPSKYKYTITLSDGTEVTLNANSELKFPVNFNGNSREVFLTGEAYFNIKKGSKPFIVNSSGIRVKAYGTEFNVNSVDNKVVKTVLVSGSIGVSSNNMSKEKMVTPNQLIVVNIATGASDISQVDVARYTAWMDDYFRYDSEKIENAIEEFRIWYGVEFEFSNAKAKNEVITALFERSSSLEEILSTVETVTGLKFIKKGGKYIIE